MIYCAVPVLVLIGQTVVAVGDTSCHIHPSGSTPQEPNGIVGPFGSVGDCEKERTRRFGPESYCHCTADFTPDWRKLEPGPKNPDPSSLL